MTYRSRSTPVSQTALHDLTPYAVDVHGRTFWIPRRGSRARCALVSSREEVEGSAQARRSRSFVGFSRRTDSVSIPQAASERKKVLELIEEFEEEVAHLGDLYNTHKDVLDQQALTRDVGDLRQ